MNGPLFGEPLGPPAVPLSDTDVVVLGDAQAWAVFSPCMKYRYVLGRAWSGDPLLAVTALNPSTATHEVLDPTLRKVVGYARRDGYGGILIRNVAAWRATDPDELAEVEDPVGPANVRFLTLKYPGVGLHVGAWGRVQNKRVRERLARTIDLARALTTHVLGPKLCQDGSPRHPLYLANATPIVPWAEARVT
ncbi:MAG TPA: DUF1643 domain-containing protein [Polyangiaceae bacterium]|jgi:hypothetical protein